MKIQIKNQFIEVTASEGKYIVDEENFFGAVVYLPLNYNTGKLREVTEEEIKNYD